MSTLSHEVVIAKVSVHVVDQNQDAGHDQIQSIYDWSALLPEVGEYALD